MKIEILEVFVTHTDAITTAAEPTPIGIAALEPRASPFLPTPNADRFRAVSGFFRLFSMFFG